MNAAGTSTGSIVSFTTSAPTVPPTVTTSAASNIAATAATLNGNITATGGANATVRGFAFGTSSALTGPNVATTTASGSFSTGAFAAALSDLAGNTTYYFRAYATNSAGTSYGSIQSFATLEDILVVGTDAPTSVGTSCADRNAVLCNHLVLALPHVLA